MVNTGVLVNNILVKLSHYVSRITAKTAVQGGSLSKNRYC